MVSDRILRIAFTLGQVLRRSVARDGILRFLSLALAQGALSDASLRNVVIGNVALIHQIVWLKRREVAVIDWSMVLRQDVAVISSLLRAEMIGLLIQSLTYCQFILLIVLLLCVTRILR